jgi:DNA-binding LytR/AlgR family response regulator
LADSINILIAEADTMHRINLEVLLMDKGYNIVGSVDNPTQGIRLFEKTNPDLVIADISLRSETDGIELAHEIKRLSQAPIIFIASTDKDDLFTKARDASPFAFITKPFDASELGRTIELAIAHVNSSRLFQGEERLPEPSPEHFFTKIGNRLKKLPVADISYIEVEGKYCALKLHERKYHVKISLKEILKKLPSDSFSRVSRNFVVNIDHIDDIDMGEYAIRVGEESIPISRTYKDELLSRITLI